MGHLHASTRPDSRRHLVQCAHTKPHLGDTHHTRWRCELCVCAGGHSLRMSLCVHSGASRTFTAHVSVRTVDPAGHSLRMSLCVHSGSRQTFTVHVCVCMHSGSSWTFTAHVSVCAQWIQADIHCACLCVCTVDPAGHSLCMSPWLRDHTT